MNGFVRYGTDRGPDWEARIAELQERAQAKGCGIVIDTAPEYRCAYIDTTVPLFHIREVVA